MNEKYLPFQVLDKDTGNVWEYASLNEARIKYKELIKMYMQTDQEFDVRMMKVTEDGDFIKWLD